MDWQSLSREECIEKLGTDAKHGLTQQQVKQRLQRYGKNELKQQKKKGLLVRFLSQFSDFMVIILLLAAAVSFVTSYVQKDADYIDSIIILFIVVVNAIVGMIQESRAEKSNRGIKEAFFPRIAGDSGRKAGIYRFNRIGSRGYCPFGNRGFGTSRYAAFRI